MPRTTESLADATAFQVVFRSTPEISPLEESVEEDSCYRAFGKYVCLLVELFTHGEASAGAADGEISRLSYEPFAMAGIAWFI